MSYGWELSSEARFSVEQQVAWHEADERHAGPELAERWLELLEPALEKLAENPKRHGLAPESGKWHPELELRQLLFRPWKKGAGWRVLYTIDEKEKRVTVLQIRHEHRRWLFETDETDE